MDISLVAAKILGTYLIISGVFLLTRGRTVPLLLRDFFDHPAIVYLTGAILIFLSALFLVQNNVWDGTWHTLITVLAWVVLLNGAATSYFRTLFTSRSIRKYSSRSSSTDSSQLPLAYSCFIIG